MGYETDAARANYGQIPPTGSILKNNKLEKSGECSRTPSKSGKTGEYGPVVEIHGGLKKS
jgi:hypothetical protein